MPMMSVDDKSQPGEIVCQVFNFVDVMGGVNNMNVEGKINYKIYFTANVPFTAFNQPL